MKDEFNNTLKFKSPHQSIDHSFNSVLLDDFSIFTGKNGSGKTHLLNAIKNGKVTFNSLIPNEIVYFNFETFKTENVPLKNPQNRSQLMDNFYNDFRKRTQNHKGYVSAIFTDNELETLKKVLQDKDKALLDITAQDIEDSEFWSKIKRYHDHCTNILSSNTIPQNMISIIKKSKKLFTEIDKDEFLTKFVQFQTKNNIIPTQLGILFYDYQLNLYNKQTYAFNNADDDTRKGDIKKAVIMECNAMFGGLSPWDMINKILSIYSDMGHEIIKPQEFDLSKYNITQNQFPVRILDKFSNKEIEFDHLSSGEKILFALTLTIFKQKLEPAITKLLLLDEIDATLHPSMLKNLFRVINEIFIKNGIKVILATHSPSTIALCETESIFVIDRKELELVIQKQSKKAALFNLTENFMTLEDGNVIFDAINKYELTIFSEGNNVDYIKTAIKIHCPNISDKIHVWEGIEGKSGVGQLKMLYHLLLSVNLRKKILIVFDPEVNLKTEIITNEEKLIFVTKLKVCGNTYVKKGVESILPDFAFEGFLITTKDEHTDITNITFPSKYKTPLCKKLISNYDPKVFENFKPLTDYMYEILQ